MFVAAAAAENGSVGGAADAGDILHAALGRDEWTSQEEEDHSCLLLAACYPGMDSLLRLECEVGVELPLKKVPAAAGTCSNCGWRAAFHPAGKRNLRKRLRGKG